MFFFHQIIINFGKFGTFYRSSPYLTNKISVPWQKNAQLIDLPVEFTASKVGISITGEKPKKNELHMGL